MDIRIEQGLPMKPQVLAIQTKLGVPKAQVVGALVMVWLWADAVTRGGRVAFEPAIIDGIADLPGLAIAMREVGWLMEDGDGFVLPRIERYTGDGRTSRDRRLTQQERARGQKRNRSGKFAGGTKNPTNADTPPIDGPIRSVPTGGGDSDLGPSQPNPTQPKPSQHNYTCVDDPLVDPLGDGDYTGADLPAGRYHTLSVVKQVEINQIIDAIPVNRRRAVAKIKRSIAAAIDRGVDPGVLAGAMRSYYASDEGSGEYATWPSNFIDQERYDEDPSAWVRGDTVDSNVREVL